MATNNLITLPLAAITPEATTLNDGHYLGHRNLQSTARDTALAPDRFAKFWRD
jgi:hypothetical protein